MVVTPSGPRHLLDSLAAHTVRPCPDTAEEADTETILIVPPPAQGGSATAAEPLLTLGFRKAEELVREGRRARLAAFGATIPETWPEWARDAPGLTLTELGAYRPDSPILATRGLARDVHRWLDGLFGDVLPELRCGGHFYASAASRVLQPLFDALPYASGLAEAHPGARFRCVDENWAGIAPLRALAAPSGGTVENVPARSTGWSVRLLATCAFHFMRAAAGQVRNFLPASSPRRALRRLRRDGPSPETWVALTSDWPRINAHVHARVALPVLERCGRLGILLCGTLVPGERSDHGRIGGDTALWPGLGPLDPTDERLIVEQTVAAGSFPALLRILGEGLWKSGRIAFRLARQGPTVPLGPAPFDLRQAVPRLAALCTTDVLQALAAAAAVRDLRGRHDMAGRNVIFSSLALVDTATVEALLRSAGTRTIDFKHGAGGDGWYGMLETQADALAVWTLADRELARQLGRESFLLAPADRLPPLRAAGPVRKILLLSGYAHANWRADYFPLLPFQTEMLRAGRLLSDARPGRFAIRWRPHPADDPRLVASAAEDHSEIALSDGRSLQQDLDWADAVIAYGGSTMAQSLFAGLPTFVHVMPSTQGYPDLGVIAPRRRFFYARDLVEPFLAFADASEQGDEEAVAPDREARAALWGDGEDDIWEKIVGGAQASAATALGPARSA